MDLRLVYVNKVGYNYKGNNLHEFLFVDLERINDINDVWGEAWEEEPAFERVQPPDEEWIHAVVEMTVHNYELITIRDSELFSMEDCKCGIIALAYEMVDDNYSYDERIVFQYGASIDDVKAILDRRKFGYVENIF